MNADCGIIVGSDQWAVGGRPVSDLWEGFEPG